MRKTLFLALFLSFGLWTAATEVAYAVPVRTYGGVNSKSGFYKLKSENGGNGNLTPGSTVTVDSYLFQCKSSGTDACSTQHNVDAVLVQKWQNNLTVPNLNGVSPQVSHSYGNLPFGMCGRVQYDQGVVGVDGAIGGWVYDFGQDCPETTTTLAQNLTCSSQRQINTQFRPSGNGAWVSGADMSDASLRTGQQVDVNCFAKTGAALLAGGVIDVKSPDGQKTRVSNTAELRNFALTQTGRYTFTCSSTAIDNCADTDTFTVRAVNASPTPSPSPRSTPTPRPTPQPSPTPGVSHRSTCDKLDVVEGNDANVPAKVKLKAFGSDNKGAIQAYRFYFGDGTRLETTNQEVTHEYTSSGKFTARVDIKDSLGNYVGSDACEAEVRVKSSSVESHKYGCSDLFISADNGAKAPSLVKFTITGYDNKGNLQGYKLDFGNGVVKESDGRTFEQRYDRSSTYPIKAYVKNSSGEWIGGNDSCQRSIVIGSSTPLQHQPSTGTPTALPLFGLGSGVAGVMLEVARRKLRV